MRDASVPPLNASCAHCLTACVTPCKYLELDIFSYMSAIVQMSLTRDSALLPRVTLPYAICECTTTPYELCKPPYRRASPGLEIWCLFLEYLHFAPPLFVQTSEPCPPVRSDLNTSSYRLDRRPVRWLEIPDRPFSQLQIGKNKCNQRGCNYEFRG